MTDISIVGWAHSAFGKLDDQDSESLIQSVAADAIADSGLQPQGHLWCLHRSVQQRIF